MSLPSLFSTYIAAGDGPFFFPGMLPTYAALFHTFDASHQFGVSLVNRFWYELPFRAAIYILSRLGLPWGVTDKVLWGGAVLLGLYSIVFMLKQLRFPRFMIAVGCLVYMTNTYSLMIFGGGQFGVFVAYALSPFFLGYLFRAAGRIRQLRKNRLLWPDAVKLGMLLGVITGVDIRFGLMLSVVYIGYLVFIVVSGQVQPDRRVTVYALIPFIVTALMQTYWLLPAMVSEGSLAGEMYTGSGIVSFLSFADLPHAISLLHPNWPDNLFGRVHFMQPEFLIIPIIAFMFLVVPTEIGKQKKQLLLTVRFLTLTALAGSVLSTGTNGLTGGAFQWAFDHIPGFVLFRDPSKFYVLTALSYAVMVPYSLKMLAEWWTRKQGFIRNLRSEIRNPVFVLCLLFTVYWLLTIRPLWLRELGGNFVLRQIPSGYAAFTEYLNKDSSFSRTLWLPRDERMTYATALHPAVSGDVLFRNASVSALIADIQRPEFATDAANAGIRYVVVSEDVEHHIYLNDYMYDPSLKLLLTQALESTNLKRLDGFGSLAVYEAPGNRPLVTGKNGKPVAFSFRDDGSIIVDTTEQQVLYVSYAYDPNWVLLDSKNRISPEQTAEGFMRYNLPTGSGSRIELTYMPDVAAKRGAEATAAFLILLFGIIMVPVGKPARKDTSA